MFCRSHTWPIVFESLACFPYISRAGISNAYSIRFLQFTHTHKCCSIRLGIDFCFQFCLFHLISLGYCSYRQCSIQIEYNPKRKQTTTDASRGSCPIKKQHTRNTQNIQRCNDIFRLLALDIQLVFIVLTISINACVCSSHLNFYYSIDIS